MDTNEVEECCINDQRNGNDTVHRTNISPSKEGGFDVGKSIVLNTGTELANKPYEMMSDLGVGGVPLKVFTKVGGGIDVLSTVFDLKEDAEKYSGSDFSKAVAIDLGGTVVSGTLVAVGGSVIGAVGAPALLTGAIVTVGGIGVGIFSDYVKEGAKLYFLPSKSTNVEEN